MQPWDANRPRAAITFVDSGLEAIEVVDDGEGISAEDMHLIGRRHHTSKITSDEEVLEVQTFGFRGEALHSLAALSTRLELLSRIRNGDPHGLGVKLTMEGGRESLQKAPAPVGTSIRIVGLLATLPVRQAEWRRQAKRHFARALWMVQSYVLAAPHVRFRCVNTGKGRTTSQQALFASSGGGDVSKAFVEAFPGDLSEPLQLLTLSDDDELFQARLYYALKDRKSADRQLCFINNRPCDLPRVLRKLNELARSHAIPGFPILLLYIQTTVAIDANLTPDKRQVILTFEDRLIDCLLRELSALLTRAKAIPPAHHRVPTSIQSTFGSSQAEPAAIVPPPPSSQPLSVPAASDATQHDDDDDEEGGKGAKNGREQGQDPLPRSEAEPASVSDPVPGLGHACDLLGAPFVSEGDDKVRVIERADFLQMTIIGQFNCGFILARMDQTNGEQLVYIIDQHASDERYRLERLQEGLQFTLQAMLRPISVPLSLDAYLYLCDHQGDCERHGFFVQIDNIPPANIPSDHGDSAHRTVKLTRCPHVAGLQLGAEGTDHPHAIRALLCLLIGARQTF